MKIFQEDNLYCFGINVDKEEIKNVFLWQQLVGYVAQFSLKQYEMIFSRKVTVLYVCVYVLHFSATSKPFTVKQDFTQTL